MCLHFSHVSAFSLLSISSWGIFVGASSSWEITFGDGKVCRWLTDCTLSLFFCLSSSCTLYQLAIFLITLCCATSSSCYLVVFSLKSFMNESMVSLLAVDCRMLPYNALVRYLAVLSNTSAIVTVGIVSYLCSKNTIFLIFTLLVSFIQILWHL